MSKVSGGWGKKPGEPEATRAFVLLLVLVQFLTSHPSTGPQMHGAFPSPVCILAQCQLVTQYLCPLISGFPYCPVLQSQQREGGTPYAEYGGWYKACKVSR